MIAFTLSCILILLLNFTNTHQVEANSAEYVVILSNVHLQDQEVIAEELLGAHINYLTASFPRTQIKRIFPNLVLYDFLAYVATLEKEALNSLKTDHRVQSIEEVDSVRVSTQNSMVSYIPFESDFIGDIENINLPHDSKSSRCTYDYEVFYEYVKQENNMTNGRHGAGVVRLNAALIFLNIHIYDAFD